MNITDEEIKSFTKEVIAEKYNIDINLLEITFKQLKGKDYDTYRRHLLREEKPIEQRRTVIMDITKNKLEFYGEWDRESTLAELDKLEERGYNRIGTLRNEKRLIDSFRENCIHKKRKELG